MRSVDFANIEEKLESVPYIQSAEVYASTKGAVHIDVQQREPLVRIVNNSGVSYYLDMNGHKMPLSSKFTARVVVATGNVENTDSLNVSDSLLKLCRFIEADKFWKAQFEQIYVTGEGEFELIPKLGNHVIRFGTTGEMEAKFEKLMVFYKEVLKNFDAEGYRIINLKFKDQIVCTKTNS
jgi:cell division protein FtsQ